MENNQFILIIFMLILIISTFFFLKNLKDYSPTHLYCEKDEDCRIDTDCDCKQTCINKDIVFDKYCPPPHKMCIMLYPGECVCENNVCNFRK